MTNAIAIIPARGGSRRIPRKNIREFHGKPIIAYSIEVAKESGLFKRVIVSTDSFDIGYVAERYGAVALSRSDGMGRDEVGTQEVMRDALVDLRGEWEYACCIYPCAPLIEPDDLRDALGTLTRFSADYVYPANCSQVDPGQWYWGRTQAFLDGIPLDGEGTIRFALPSARSIDINTEADWKMAEAMYEVLNDRDDASCSHDFQLAPPESSDAIPELVHFQCRKCGHVCPT